MHRNYQSNFEVYRSTTYAQIQENPATLEALSEALMQKQPRSYTGGIKKKSKGMSWISVEQYN